jgi:FixJ family two-component response regulator
MNSQLVGFGSSEFDGPSTLAIMLISQPSSDQEIGLGSKPALIAIVEDDPSVRKSLERLIKAEGFRTIAFASAEDFLQRGDHRATNCLILDLRLPGMSGLELQHHLVTGHDAVPIVFVSAHDEPETRYKALQAGAAAFLSKPVNDDVLVDTIRSVVK